MKLSMKIIKIIGDRIRKNVNMFEPISDNKKIVPYEVKAEQERQESARAQQQGDPTGIPTSILKEQKNKFEYDIKLIKRNNND